MYISIIQDVEEYLTLMDCNSGECFSHSGAFFQSTTSISKDFKGASISIASSCPIYFVFIVFRIYCKNYCMKFV